MKTLFIFLCLIINGGLASATTQTSASQDKPPRLYVKSYSESDNYSGTAHGTNVYWYNEWNGNYYSFATNIYTHSYSPTANETTAWHDGASVIYTLTSHYQESNIHGPNGTQDDTTTLSSPQSWWPDIIGGTEVESSTGAWTYDWPDIWSTNTYSSITYTNQYAAINQEHCDINISSNWLNPDNVSGIGYSTHRRAVQTTLKLQTGGKATSKLRNLFKLTAGASKNDYYIVDWEGYLGTASTGIPSQNINLGSYGALNTNGVMYKILPDNADVDVTPYVAGADYYTFNVGATEYHSYFEVSVYMPYPPGSGVSLPGGYMIYPNFITVGNGNLETGHTMWHFSTEAPTNVVNQLISTDRSHFLGPQYGGFNSQIGYGCPSYSVNFDILFLGGTVSGPGALYYPDPDSNLQCVTRKYDIGFDDLINGLGYTKELQDHPGTYYGLLNNCVTQTRIVADTVGVSLPSAAPPFPEVFGLNLNDNPQF